MANISPEIRRVLIHMTGAAMLLQSCHVSPPHQVEKSPLPVVQESTPANVEKLLNATPVPEVLDTRIIENTRRDVLKLDNYSSNLRQKIVNLWLQGETRAVEYTKDSQSYLFSLNAAKPDPLLKAMAETKVSLERRNLSTGSSALVFVLSGSYNPALATQFPEPIKNRMTAMNFEHEAVVSLALINGLIRAGKDLGFNFSYPAEAGPEESRQRSQLNKYIPAISFYAEAVAEANDYILTYPLLDKDPQGQVLFVSHSSSKNPLPLMNRLAFFEGGLTFIIDQTIGPTLKEIGNLDQLAQRYPSLENIPGSMEYLKQIQQYFQPDSLSTNPTSNQK